MSWPEVTLLAAAIAYNTMSIRHLQRRTSLLEGSSRPRPRSFREYLGHRKGSAK